MKIGMIPFNTVNWVLSQIPLVGKNVAGSTHSIISAYFNARGPITNPRVTPGADHLGRGDLQEDARPADQSNQAEHHQVAMELILYTRRDCELCREMESVIDEVMPRFQAQLKRVEIDGDAALEAQFGLEVPVLFVNGRKAFKYRCTERELRKRLGREK